ncbi:MAG TPA: AsmA-like C-terminal region-containing protein, partial [Bacillota bacterium]|nr:AsmA-like C-terminal region-containing protein [Bacillota bacterium]
TARVYGTIPLRDEEDADVHFEIAGGMYHWWKFTVPNLAGHVHWQGSRLTLTDVRTDFYEGSAVGAAVFDFTPEVGTDFQFSLTTTNTLLQALMADLSPRTNHLEGRLNATLVVTRANTEDWRSVCGYGDLDLRDGLIWDIPIFGIFTPVLNSLAPGLGHSRASAGTCTYVITNGVFRTDNLELRAPALHLVYRGTVDLQEQVNARVEAELLRDMWVVGPLVSTVFWPVTKMFEYKVSGSMDQPKMQPVFLIPKLMMLPFHPFRTLKSLVPEENNTNRATAPPR